ncbi:hypothetical protein ACFYUY_10085 [Kitasatospora sp. NPDC004745]|uniref:hypothetical protein n=1 Tax=Kitasatospora sp. NPDC004745 TaxID=3364019 RepID=UPI00369382C1
MTAGRRPGQAPPPDRTRYRVTYAVAGEPGTRRDEVEVVPGYSGEGDVPRILAARLAAHPGERPGGRPGDRPGGRSQPNDLRITVLELREI